MKKVTINILILFVCLANVFPLKLKALADANVRAEPSGKAKIIEIANKDSVFDGNLSDENDNWFYITLENGKNGFVHKSLIEEIQSPKEPDSFEKIASSFANFSSEQLIIIGIVALIIWIAAAIMSKTTRCVIVYNWHDLVALLIPDCVFLLHLLDVKFVAENTTLMTIGCVMAFSVSCLLTIKGNIKSKSKFFILYIFISLLTKIVLIILGPIAIFAIIGSLYASITGRSFFKNDGRFTDGTKGNTWTLFATIILGLVFGVLSLLIMPLVKTDEMIESSQKINQ